MTGENGCAITVRAGFCGQSQECPIALRPDRGPDVWCKPGGAMFPFLLVLSFVRFQAYVLTRSRQSTFTVLSAQVSSVI